MRRQVAIVDLGLVIDCIRPVVGSFVSVGRSHFGSIARRPAVPIGIDV